MNCPLTKKTEAKTCGSYAEYPVTDTCFQSAEQPPAQRSAADVSVLVAEGAPRAGQPLSALAALQEARYVIESVICDPNFEGLVLGCMDSYDSESRRILQRFSKCT